MACRGLTKVNRFSFTKHPVLSLQVLLLTAIVPVARLAVWPAAAAVGHII